MASFSLCAAALLLFATPLAQAIELQHALATAQLLPDLVQGFSPAPTLPPSRWPDLAGAKGIPDLFQRQLGLHTCGYISGQQSSYLTCGNGYVCATGSVDNVAACCDPGRLSICYLPTSCVNYADLSSKCGSSCSQNPFVTRCTDSANPACFTWAYNYGTATPTEVGCTISSFSEVVELSYTGGTPTFSGTIHPAATVDDITTYTIATSSAVDLSTLITTSTISTSSTSTSMISSSSSSSASSSTSALSSSSSTIVSSASTVAQSTGGGGGSKTGAIVGGVIGGLAFVAIIVALVVWLLLRNRRRKAAAGASSTAPSPMYPQTSTVTPGSYAATPASHVVSPVSNAGYYGDNANPGITPQSQYSELAETEYRPAVEADSDPVMTNAEGRQIHELAGH